MKNARQLLEEFTASSSRDPKKTAEMFAADGAFEMPYLDSLGFPRRYEGREKVEESFKFVRDLYPDMDFHDVKVVCETPDVVVGEYEFTTKSSNTGRVIHQLFVGRLEAENGQISCFANRSIWLRWDWPSIQMVWLTTRRLQRVRSKTKTLHQIVRSDLKSQYRLVAVGFPRGIRGRKSSLNLNERQA